jgi:hypothetical protein
LATIVSNANQDTKREEKPKDVFQQGSDRQPMSLVREFAYFIVEYKAWWMIPLLIIFGLMGLLVWLAPTGATPFIYTLF